MRLIQGITTRRGIIRTLALLLLLLISRPLSADDFDRRDHTMRFDVVELVNGKRVEATEDFATSHGKFTYWFVDEANLKKFQASPETYAIQLGGACARMGPLSGEGTPRLPAVHDGKVYLFASEACRNAFLDAPDHFLATDDPKPAVTEETAARGRRLLGKAVDAIACHAQIDAVTTYRETLQRTQESRGETYTVADTVTLMRPDGVRVDNCWNDTCWAFVARGGDAWSEDADGTIDLVLAQRMELLRNECRHPYRFLWARDSKDIIAMADGAHRTITVPDDGEIDVELVTVHFEHAATTLGLDDDGRIRFMAYRGRGPDGTIGDVERIYSRFRALDGLNVPSRVDVSFNSEPVPNASGEFARQIFDDPSDVDGFHRRTAHPPVDNDAELGQ